MAKDFANGFDAVRQAALAAGITEPGDSVDVETAKIVAALEGEAPPAEGDGE